MKRLWLAAALVGVALVFGARALPGGEAEAIAPCIPHVNTSEEWQFLGLLQAWRDGQGLSAGQQLVMTASLNQAAKGFAQFLADNPGAGDHDADGFWPWDRAKNCGYASTPSGQVSAGEGLAGFADMGPQAALAFMASHPGSGIYMPSSSRFPVMCAGVAKAVGAGGRTVWVTLIAVQLAANCPGAVGQVPATSTPTSTASLTPTPTKPPATPPAGVKIAVGWNLVVLPPGPIASLMAAFAGCFDAVYGWQPLQEQWLRWAPGAPGYVSNLVASDGSGLWVHGTRVCG